MRLLLILYLCARATAIAISPDWQTVYSDDSAPLLLHDSWQLYNDDDEEDVIQVPSLPSDLWTILWKTGRIIDDPYFDRNFLTQRQAWMGNVTTVDGLEIRQRTWTFVRSMKELQRAANGTSYLLVIESIKMGAVIEADGVVLETVTDQFLRSSIPLPAGTKSLKIIFDPNISTDGRFMACSGGWDWSPYTRTGDGRGSRTGTLGVVQPIYLVPMLDPMVIHAVVPKLYYDGPYPTRPLNKGNFTVQVDVHFEWYGNSMKEHVVLMKTDFTSDIQRVSLTCGQPKATIVLEAKDVDLWWPRGMGKQSLYHIYIALDNPSSKWIKRRIGFRTVAVVTTDDTNSSLVRDIEKKEGSGGHGLFFRVNGAIVNCRGANMVPMDVMEGRWTTEAHRSLVQSAARANMNMLRVWGGGAILPDMFYDTCDETGILVYHDLMFVGEQNHSAFRTNTIEREIRHIVRKVSSHPSIILWSGCNECDYYGGDMSIYENFVLSTVASEDDSRAIWPSSPSSYGWETGVDTAYSRPNGKPLKIRNIGRHKLEVHGPYLRGFSDTYPGVNGIHSNETFETHIPPSFENIGEKAIGPQFPNFFVSEFGASVSSSFESLSATLLQSTWSLHGGSGPDSCMHVIGSLNICNGTNVMAERNYPCDSLIEAFFGLFNSLDDVGAKPFAKSLYQCMISQALWMKGQIELFRYSNSYGTLIWQLNEIWPTGGWGAVEYGSNRGAYLQVVGGRWKPLMYLLKQTLFRDLMVACGSYDGSLCYVRNDAMVASNVRVRAEAWNLNNSTALKSKDFRFRSAEVNPLARFQLPQGWTADSDVVLLTAIACSHDFQENCTADSENSNAFIWQTPLELSTRVIRIPSCQITWDQKTCEDLLARRRSNKVSFTFQCDRLMLYVFLATAARGTFDVNSFHVRPHEEQRIAFEADSTNDLVDLELFQRSFRFDHLFSGFEYRDESILFDNCVATVNE